MARRSYLRRIAEPLQAGDPVLFPVPRPAPEEARPVSVFGAAQESTAAAPVLRRKPARGAVAPPPAVTRGVPAAGGVSPAAAVSHMAAASPPVSGSLPEPAAGTVAIDGPRPMPMDAAPAHAEFVAQAGPLPMPVSATSPAGPFIAESQKSDAPSAPAAGALTEAAPPASDVGRNAAPVALRAPPAMEIARPAERAALRGNAAPEERAAGPRIHIGTVEVRVVPPPAAPAPVVAPRPAPGAATAPIARPYGWRFGLVQA